MGLFSNYILSEKKEEKEYKFSKDDEGTDGTDNIKDTEDDEGAEGAKGIKDSKDLPSVDKELKEIISDMTDEEKDILLAHAYALVLADADLEDDEDSEDSDEDEDSDGDEEKVTENFENIIVTFKDSLGNKRILKVSDNGNKLNLSNQNRIALSLSNLAFMIGPDDFRAAGYKNSGNADKALWVKNSAVAAWKSSKGIPTKFASEFSKLMQIRFYVSDTRGEMLSEAAIIHQTGSERTAGKMKRRQPKWKRKAKIRYIKNKKCPVGTTYSQKDKSCTHIDIDMSRLQKLISKMKIRI